MKLSWNVLYGYFATKTSSKIIYHCFFYIFSYIKNKKWNSHEGYSNYDNFVLTKYFPVSDVHKSTKGKTSFIRVADFTKLLIKLRFIIAGS